MAIFFVLVLPFLALSMRKVWPEPARRYLPKVLFLWASSAVIYVMSIALAIGLQFFTYGRIAKKAFGI